MVQVLGADASGGPASAFVLRGAPGPESARPRALSITRIFAVATSAELPPSPALQGELYHQAHQGGPGAGPVEQHRLLAAEGDRVEPAQRVQQPQSGVGG